jgi:ATP-dependent DNA ligase
MARPWCSASTASPTQSLHSRKHDHEVQLYAFDCLALGGDDLCRLPLHLRKTNLAQPLRGRAEGIFVAPFAQGEIGPELFEAACRMGLEGLVSKHRERVYRAGRCDQLAQGQEPETPGLQPHRGPVLRSANRKPATSAALT